MDTVLIAFDGSRKSLAAVHDAVRRRALVSRVELVHVQARLPRYVSRWVARANRDDWRRDRACRALAPAAEILAQAGVPYGMHLVVGPAAPALGELAKTLHADSVVAPQAQPSWVERYVLPAGLGLLALVHLAFD